MRKYNVVIADDESLTRVRIRNLLKAYSNFEVVAEAANGAQTLQALKAYQVDVIFLDIKMPILDGFEVLKQLKGKDYRILVFITAYEQYALKAFENEAMDYLLKPFDESRFRKLMLRITDYFKRLDGSRDQHILVKVGAELAKVNIDDIVYLRSDNNHVRIVLEKEEFRKRTSMESIEKVLDSRFLRIHRSYIINEARVQKMKHISNGDYLFTMSNNKAISSSKTYRKNVALLV